MEIKDHNVNNLYKDNININNNNSINKNDDNSVLVELLFKYFNKPKEVKTGYTNKNILLNEGIYRNANCDFRHNRDVGFLENTINIIQIIRENKFNLSQLIDYLTYSTSKSIIPIKHPYMVYDLYNYIPYDEAIQVFQLYNNGSNNNNRFSGFINSIGNLDEISKVFLSLQFFVYYRNKIEKNNKEYLNFIVNLVFDKSPLIGECLKSIIKLKLYIGQTSQVMKDLDLILVIIYQNQTKLQYILNSSNETQKQFSRNIKSLLTILKSQKYYITLFTPFIDNHPPTSASQFFFLQVFYKKLFLLLKSGFVMDEAKKKLDTYKQLYGSGSINRDNISSYSSMEISTNSPNKRGKQETLESDNSKRLKTTTITTSLKHRNNHNNQSHYINHQLNSNIIQNIIIQTLNIKQLFESDSPYLDDKSIEEELLKGCASWTLERKWDYIINYTKRNILALALVSKDFHHILCLILQSLDWSEYKVDKLFYSNKMISYNRKFSLIQRPSKSIMYHTLINSTPFENVNFVFSKIESLSIIGESDSSLANYDYFETSYSTFPPKNSLLSLKKLSFTGTCYKDSKDQDTIGLYLIKYIIINCGIKLEEFSLIDQSFHNFDQFDISIIQYLLKYHQATLKTIKIKLSIETAESIHFAKKVITLMKPYQHRTKLEIYRPLAITQNYNPLFLKKPRFKIDTDINEPNNQNNKLEESLFKIDNYREVKEMDERKIELKRIKDINKNYDSNINYHFRNNNTSNNRNTIIKYDNIRLSLYGFSENDQLFKELKKIGNSFGINNISDRLTEFTTHFIPNLPIHSNQIMYAICRGTWIIKPSWLLKSQETGKLEKVLDHIYNEEDADPSLIAANECIQTIRSNNLDGLFKGSRIAVYTIKEINSGNIDNIGGENDSGYDLDNEENNNDIDSFKIINKMINRIPVIKMLRYGNAQIIKLTSPVTSLDILKAKNPTHFLNIHIDNSSLSERLEELIQNDNSSNIQVLSLSIIEDHVRNATPLTIPKKKKKSKKSTK